MIGAESSRTAAFGSILLVSDIYSWVHIVNIFLVQLIPQKLNSFAKALEMDNFPLPQEFDRIIHIGIITDPQDVVIGRPGFLFRSQIFSQISDRISLDLHGRRTPGHSRSRCRVHASRMINKVRCECGVFHLRTLHIPRQLMNNRSDHL